MSMSLSTKWETQPEKLDVRKKGKEWKIGLPKPPAGESRIPLIPSSVRVLCSRGLKIIIESEAGKKAGYTDQDYTESGADIAYSRKEVFRADIILQTFPPLPEDMTCLRTGQMLISPLHVGSLELDTLNAMREKRVIGLAMEYMKDRDGSFPIVRILSELAGTGAVLQAAHWMTAQCKGSGLLLGGISGVPPAKVVILGAGVVAEYAIRAALGLGAQICVLDNNIYKLMRLQNILGRRLSTSALEPVTLEKELLEADVAIGAIHSSEGRSPMVVSEEMVMKMKPGAVIVDVSIDQGGCFETSRPTTMDQPVFEKHNVIHYAVPNIASNYPKTASRAISNILSPLFVQAADAHGMDHFIYQTEGLAHGVYLFKGSVTNQYLSSKFGLKYTALELLISSEM